MDIVIRHFLLSSRGRFPREREHRKEGMIVYRDGNRLERDGGHNKGYYPYRVDSASYSNS